MTPTLNPIQLNDLEAICGPYLDMKNRPLPEQINQAVAKAEKDVAQLKKRPLLDVLLRRHPRATHVVKDEYEKAYGSGLEKLELLIDPQRRRMVRFGEECFDGSSGAIYRTYLHYVREAIQKTGAKRVLEVGSGSGKNLFALATSHGDCSYEGLEYSEAGVRLATEVTGMPRLAPNLAVFCNVDEGKTEAIRNIPFRQGDASALPYDDNAFDLVFTMLAQEQMRPILDKVLPEIRRVAAGHVIFVEPFFDANDERGQSYIRNRGYFDLTAEDVERYGYETLTFTKNILRKMTFGAGVYFGKAL